MSSDLRSKEQRPAASFGARFPNALRRLRRRLLGFVASLRGRQLILVAAGLVPTILLLVYMVLEVRKHQVERAFQEATVLARVVAEEQAGLINSTRQLLEVLSRLPEVLSDDPLACNLLFEGLRQREPIYNNLGTTDAAGNVLCSGIPMKTPVTAAERSWFVRAKRTGAFAVGDYQIGEVSGTPVMVVALPVFTENGDLHRVVAASLSLNWLPLLVGAFELPPAVAVALVDGDGRVLAKVPERHIVVGEPLPSAELRSRILGAEDSGIAEIVDRDRGTRLAAFAPVGDTDLHAVVTWRKDDALAAIDRTAEHLTVGMAAAVIALLLATFWAGRAFLLRPVEALARAASRLAEGDLSARAGVSPRRRRDEIGRLAQVFDRMAAQIEQRHERLRRGEARAEALLRDAIESAADAVALWDHDDRLVLCNQRYRDFFPQIADDLEPGAVFTDVCRRFDEAEVLAPSPDGPAGWLDERLAQRRERWGEPLEWQLRDGRWIRVTDYATAEGGVLTFISDITEAHLAEAALRESRERLQVALAAADTGTFRWNLDSRTVDGDESLNRLFGLEGDWRRSADDYVERVDPDDRVAVSAAVKQGMRDGSEAEFEFRIRHPDGSERWLATRGRFVVGDDGRAVCMNGACVDVTQRKRSEEQLHLLLAELSHRVKNTLATVQSIAHQTLRGADSLDSFTAAFTGRIGALADVHSLLVRNQWGSCDLSEVLKQQLRPHSRPEEGNVVFEGPPLTLSPRACLCLSMVIHELTTNALKYGALSRSGGGVALTWKLTGTAPDRYLELCWRERGGPPVTPPERPGFGTVLIERSVAHELDGQTTFSWRPDGLVCDFRIPWTSEPVGGQRRGLAQ